MQAPEPFRLVEPEDMGAAVVTRTEGTVWVVLQDEHRVRRCGGCWRPMVGSNGRLWTPIYWWPWVPPLTEWGLRWGDFVGVCSKCANGVPWG